MRILHIDDHPILHDAVRALILKDYPNCVIDVCSTLYQAKENIDLSPPDIIITDLQLQNENGISFIEEIRQSYPNIPISVFSFREDFKTIDKAIKAGAMGYVTKQDQPSQIVRAIKSLLQNKKFLSEIASSAMIEALHPSKDQNDIQVEERLTKREMEVFTLLGQEQSRKEIAAELEISSPTVDTHIERIKNKLEIESSYKLLCFALKHFSESQ